MASNIRPLPPPLRAPMLDAGGYVTAVWADWFNTVFRFQRAQDGGVDNATYTLGLGTTDGTITTVDGVITAIQEVVA